MFFFIKYGFFIFMLDKFFPGFIDSFFGYLGEFLDFLVLVFSSLAKMIAFFFNSCSNHWFFSGSCFNGHGSFFWLVFILGCFIFIMCLKELEKDEDKLIRFCMQFFFFSLTSTGIFQGLFLFKFDLSSFLAIEYFWFGLDLFLFFIVFFMFFFYYILKGLLHKFIFGLMLFFYLIFGTLVGFFFVGFFFTMLQYSLFSFFLVPLFIIIYLSFSFGFFLFSKLVYVFFETHVKSEGYVLGDWQLLFVVFFGVFLVILAFHYGPITGFSLMKNWF